MYMEEIFAQNVMSLIFFEKTSKPKSENSNAISSKSKFVKSFDSAFDFVWKALLGGLYLLRESDAFAEISYQILFELWTVSIGNFEYLNTTSLNRIWKRKRLQI